jgi:hypothetical protein
MYALRAEPEELSRISESHAPRRVLNRLQELLEFQNVKCSPSILEIPLLDVLDDRMQGHLNSVLAEHHSPFC